MTKEFKIPIKETFLWTDSKIALHYLQNENRNSGIYVSHRVNETLEKTELMSGITSPLNLLLQTKQVDIKHSSSYS